MELKKRDINKLIKLKTIRLAKYVQRRDNIEWNEALIKIAGTKTYERLQNENTAYYLESDEYIWNQYELELAGNWEEWMKL